MCNVKPSRPNENILPLDCGKAHLNTFCPIVLLAVLGT